MFNNNDLFLSVIIRYDNLIEISVSICLLMKITLSERNIYTCNIFYFKSCWFPKLII